MGLDGSKFRQARRIVACFKFSLEKLQDIKEEHDAAIDKLGQSLADIEEHLAGQGVKVELLHLVNSANFLDDNRLDFYRKKILDQGNALKREAEGE